MGKYIEAEKLKEIFNAKGDMAVGIPKTVFYNATKIVDTLPGADVVEIIRCGGCRYYNRRWGCRKLEINVSANDYCFMAEPAVADGEVVLPDEK